MRLAACVLLALTAVACTGDDDADAPTASAAPAGTVSAALPTLSPFCTGIAEMTARLGADDAPDDVTAFLIGSYQDLLPVAPPELTADLEALIASLSAPSTTTTTGVPSTAVSVAPDDLAPPVLVVTPGERIADYVAEQCGRIGANPGPPATPPGGGYDTVADTPPPTSTPAAAPATAP